MLRDGESTYSKGIVVRIDAEVNSTVTAMSLEARLSLDSTKEMTDREETRDDGEEDGAKKGQNLEEQHEELHHECWLWVL